MAHPTPSFTSCFNSCVGNWGILLSLIPWLSICFLKPCFNQITHSLHSIHWQPHLSRNWKNSNPVASRQHNFQHCVLQMRRELTPFNRVRRSGSLLPLEYKLDKRSGKHQLNFQPCSLDVFEMCPVPDEKYAELTSSEQARGGEILKWFD